MKPCASTFTAASCGAIQRLPGFTSRDRGGLRGEHELVDVALRAAEAAVDRETCA